MAQELFVSITPTNYFLQFSECFFLPEIPALCSVIHLCLCFDFPLKTSFYLPPLEASFSPILPGAPMLLPSF